MLTLHESDGGNECIDNTGIMSLPRFPAQFFVHDVGIPAYQILRMRNANEAQTMCQRRADIGDLFQSGVLLTIHNLPRRNNCPNLRPWWQRMSTVWSLSRGTADGYSLASFPSDITPQHYQD